MLVYSRKRESPAHFFEYIEPGPLPQMSIPESFRKNIKRGRKNQSAILKRGSKKWFVSVSDWVFGKGWEKFTRENGVKEFDIVVFKHEGNMVFDTMVFNNISRCERECSNNRVTESSRKRKIDTNEFTHEFVASNDTIPVQHPYFIGTLRSTDSLYELRLPSNFTRSNGLITGEMILKNGQSQKSWTVEVKIHEGSYTCIGRGWHEFCIENRLKEGDQFKLELIQTGNKPVAIFYNLGTNQTESHGIVETPYFVGTIGEYTNAQYRMYIPKKFALENGLTNGELILKHVENEGSWTVNLSNHLGIFYYIISGLKEFCIANGYEKGDGIKFKLIQSGKKPIFSISK
ncbi:putative transcription factor B3-Domain family [Helianthus annuus]|nr:putative transcription factor B3-Domain family [Helianthus annuus]